MKDTYTLPAAADFHVHLRDGDVSKVVTPTIRFGGVDTVYVMPNLVPPVTTVSMALEYKKRLQNIDPSINYLMVLYLHESIDANVVRQAKKAGIVGIKSYPAGVTTNSSSGVISYEPFYPVFEAMQEEGLVLNLHGEVPSDGKDITVMNAEPKFLPTLQDLHRRFPRLRIVLEHTTTADAVEAVRSCGDTVVGTITAHHLSILVDDWAGNVFCYCKPVAKLPADRRALLDALVNSDGRFFLGTDSAPHDISAKKGKGNAAAGVFTQPYACQYVLSALEDAIERGDIKDEAVTEEVLGGFLGEWGRKFYGIAQSTQKIVLKKGSEVIAESIKGHGVEIVPFQQGKPTWTVEWQ
ncbi:dihydroorotase [Pseudomassariella vexata]|uniref:dihydroorotase n=1 Tax=Pseudomassariella vexata TaxID=1141098 RepID=A0A1Y2DTR2_9PEZI|nr:dihydroorotase [Pseudomassariella vexata]ORY62526.1 dihydroorotase [Pseudomassariella vexata]